MEASALWHNEKMSFTYAIYDSIDVWTREASFRFADNLRPAGSPKKCRSWPLHRSQDVIISSWVKNQVCAIYLRKNDVGECDRGVSSVVDADALVPGYPFLNVLIPCGSEIIKVSREGNDQWWWGLQWSVFRHSDWWRTAAVAKFQVMLSRGTREVYAPPQNHRVIMK